MEQAAIIAGRTAGVLRTAGTRAYVCGWLNARVPAPFSIQKASPTVNICSRMRQAFRGGASFFLRPNVAYPYPL
jgi:hypothetical protein